MYGSGNRDLHHFPCSVTRDDRFPKSNMDISSAHAQIAKILEIEKETYWIENATLPPDEIQRQWAIKTAPLTAVLGVGAPTRRVDLGSVTEKSVAPQNTQAIELPQTIPSGNKSNMNEAIHHDTSSTTDMPNVVSQPQSRKRSSHSRNGPFVDTDTVVPPLTLNTWQANHDEPFSCYSSASSSPPAFKTRKTASGRLPDYSSMSVYDPADFVKQSRSTLSPISSPNAVRSRRNSSQTRSPSSYLSQSPSTPVSEGLTNPTTLSSIGMSRSDSLGGASFYGGFNMLKVDSQRSESMFKCDKDSPCALDSTSTSANPPVPSNDLALTLSYTGSMVEPVKTSTVPLVAEENCIMSRTASSDSTDSSQSRISRRSQEQAALSVRPLAPKDSAESMLRQSSSSSSGPEMVRQVSADGSKIAIQKAKYQRPTHEKIKCKLCTLKPDGYRGPHELRRHMDNKHTTTRKVWVCKDLSPDQKFLSKCKQCRERKKYGAYYNAACHLRRIHWNPREKGKKADKSGKGRGGNGGGDFPSMDHLKLWMEEIYVPVTEGALVTESDHEEDDAINNLAADPSQNGFELDFQSESFAHPDSTTNTNSLEFSSQEPHYPLAYDGGYGQADFSASDSIPNFFYTFEDNTSTKPKFSPTLNSADIPAYSTSTPSSTVPVFTNSDSLKITPMNSNLAFDDVKAVNTSLTSSMNSPAGHLDQLNSFSFDADMPDFT